MADIKNYQKKKNALIITFMALLLIFVCLICFIFIYVKQHPKKEYVSQDDIEIKDLVSIDYDITSNQTNYKTITESTDFILKNEKEEVSLKVSSNNKIVISETEEEVKVLLNTRDVNNNVKFIYQDDNISLILTNDGKLYKLSDITLTEDNNINVGQILSATRVKNIVKVLSNPKETYVLTQDNKTLNVDSLEEYDGIIRELVTNEGILYIYSDYSFALEKGKVFTDEEGKVVRFNIFFDKKLVDENAIIYEVDFQNNAVSTSKLGILSKVGYGPTSDNKYNISFEANTGKYSLVSDYYYTR